MSGEPVKLPHYVTDKGLLLNLKTDRPEQYRVNDAKLTPTFNRNWWLVDGEKELRGFTIHGGTRPINRRYVLINESVCGVEKVIPFSAVEDDGEGEWVGQYAGLRSLYRYEADKEDIGFLPADFRAIALGSVTLAELGNPSTFSYKVHGTGFLTEAEKSSSTLTYNDIFKEYDWAHEKIQVDDIAKAMTPEVAWHLYPCSISSELAYRIVRAWVKDHIDPMYAVVTSDYDFCFTVEKKIRVVPYVKKQEQLTNRLKSYNPPRFTNRAVEYEKRKVFEMTNAKDAYRGYPVIAGFRASSLAELAQVIDQYLHDLMEVINDPLTKCQHCNGLGVIDYHKLDTNERDALRMKRHQA